jgi:hypothetical protein
MPMTSKILAITFVLSGLLLTARAQDMPVPPELQAAIFKKVFSYDKTIQGGEPRMIVAFTDASAGIKDQVVKAFKDSGVTVTAVKADQLSGAVSGINVVYIAPGVSGVKQLCQKNGILSITGLPSLVESGEVSVGLSVLDNKPKIIVHLRQLKAEGHELSANLLQLAKVIQ